MEKISVAIIGLGRIASLLEDDPLREKPCTHAGSVTANPDCMLVAGADVNEERRNLFASRWNCPTYDSAELMLKAHNVQILIIATHPDSHACYCFLAKDYGVPVVICEKPLADNIEDARKIAHLYKSNETKILTNHERRYALDYLLAKSILDEKRLGVLLSVSATLYMGVKKQLLDMFWHDGTHLVDIIMFLTGGVLRHENGLGADLISCCGTAFLFGYIEGKDSIPVVLEIGSGRDYISFEIKFSCERGCLRIGNGIFEIWESEKSPYAEGFKSLKKTSETFDGKTGYFTNMISDAVACVKNPDLKPRSSAEDGLRVIEYLSHQ